MNLFQLNPEQQAAVRQTDGPLLLLAGAGSGKTRVITTRLAYLLQHKKIPAEQLLAVTFTNKAAREMRERVTELVGKTASHEMTLSTFHALGVRILRTAIERCGYKKNFSIYAASDQLRLIRDLLRESDLNKNERSDIGRVLATISDAKNRLIPPHAFKAHTNDPVSTAAARIYPLYQQALRAYNAIDFDDILMLTVQLLQEHDDIRHIWCQRYQYVMVDEYQDTNFVQYQLLRLLCAAHRNLCVVGDDDQSIYGWRGAQPGNILDFEKDFPGACIIKLEQNYRSTGTILAAANAVIGHNTTRHVKRLWSATGSGAAIELCSCADGDEEARTVVERIQALRFREQLLYSDFAVLYRTNAQSRALEEQLRYENIPYILIGGQQFFDRKEVKDALAYLHVIANVQDEINLLRILNYPRRGIGETSAERLIHASSTRHKLLWEILRAPHGLEELGEKPLDALRQFVALIEKYRVAFQRTRRLSETCREFFRDIGLEDEIWRTADDMVQGKRRLENISEVLSALSAYEERDSKPTLSGFLEKVSLLDRDEAGQGDKEAKLASNAVVLMSLHSSKGLEFPHVFLVGLEEDLLPHCTSEGEMADIEEERRLLYVGITRARRTLTLLHAHQRKKYGRLLPRNPSRFLKELPDELLRRSQSQSSLPTTEEEQSQRADSFFSSMKAMLDS